MNRCIKTCLILVLFAIVNGCIKEDVANIGNDINLKPEYALPIGSPTTYLNQYVELLNSLNAVDTALVSDTVAVFLYDNDFYETPVQLSYDRIEAFSFITLQDKVEYFTSLMFRTNVSNKIPAKMEVQAYFLDAGYSPIDSLYKSGPLIIEAASIDDKGNVTEPYELWKYDTYFSQEEIQRLINVNYIQIVSRLHIENVEGVYTKYYSNQDFWLQLGAKIKLDINMNEI